MALILDNHFIASYIPSALDLSLDFSKIVSEHPSLVDTLPPKEVVNTFLL